MTHSAMAITAQANHGLRPKERLEDGIQLARSIEFLAIIARQDDLQGLGIAEDDGGRHPLAQATRSSGSASRIPVTLAHEVAAGQFVIRDLRCPQHNR